MKALYRPLIISFLLISNQSYAINMNFSNCDTEACIAKFKEFRRFAKNGSPQAQMTLAGMYYSGYGVSPNSKKSLFWYRKAGKKGAPFARYRSALLYLFDKNIERNVPKGIELLEYVVKSGNGDAAYVLADLYIQGKLVPENMKQAEKWLLRGNELNHANSQYRLGLLYESGVLGNKQLEKAIELYKVAAVQNTLASQRFYLLSPNNSPLEAKIDFNKNKDIEHITVTPPELIDVLNSFSSNIKKQRIYTDRVTTGSRLPGSTCETCDSLTNPWDIEDFFRSNGN